MAQSAGAKAAKTLIKIVEKFGAVFTGYENKLETESKLKKSAIDAMAKLITMKEIDGISATDLDPIIANLTTLLRTDEKYDEIVDKVCSDLYLAANKYKGD
jgi:hypothetical protein